MEKVTNEVLQLAVWRVSRPQCGDGSQTEPAVSRGGENRVETSDHGAQERRGLPRESSREPLSFFR